MVKGRDVYLVSNASHHISGPYALAGVGLALALVALIGLVLITCRNADSPGAPGSF